MSDSTTNNTPAPASAKTTAIVITAVVVLLGASVAVAALRPSASPKPAAEKPAVKPSGKPVSINASQTASGATTGTPVLPAAKPGTKGRSAATAPGGPRAVAQDGSKLATLTAPPQKTIGMIVVNKGFKGGTFSIVFKPFGWGPSGPSGGRLVAQIDSAKALDAGAKSLDRDFAGRNATLWTSPDIAKLVAEGGTYTGTMEVRPQGDVGVLYLTKASAK